MDNQILTVLKNRRSIRKFQQKQVAEDALKAVLGAADFAPCGKGAQAAKVIAVQNREDIATLSKLNAAILKTDTDPYYGAPTILVVLVDRSRPTAVEDGSCLLTYIMVAAASVGLGTCWIHREKQIFDSPEGKALLRKWGVEGDYIGVGACSLGYPDGPVPEAAPRVGYTVRVL